MAKYTYLPTYQTLRMNFTHCQTIVPVNFATKILHRIACEIKIRLKYTGDSIRL